MIFHGIWLLLQPVHDMVRHGSKQAAVFSMLCQVQRAGIIQCIEAAQQGRAVKFTWIACGSLIWWHHMCMLNCAQ